MQIRNIATTIILAATLGCGGTVDEPQMLVVQKGNGTENGQTSPGDASGDTNGASSTSSAEGPPTSTSEKEATSADSAPPTRTKAGEQPNVRRKPSFHIVVAADRYAYDAILAARSDADFMLATTTNKPEGLAHENWAMNVSPLHTKNGRELADRVIETLDEPVGPAIVMIDEIRSGSRANWNCHWEHADCDCDARRNGIPVDSRCERVPLAEEIRVAAYLLRRERPDLAGKWGAYLVNGVSVSYPNLSRSIDELLRADAIIGVEMYPHKSQYCSAGSTVYERDVWLGDFFRGSRGAFANKGRVHWLMERRKSLDSDSHVTILFGVIDRFVGDLYGAAFVDRMMYVWRTRSGYPSLISAANGGAGGWKWDQRAMTNTSRDLAFIASWQHYEERTNARENIPQVPCL